MKLLENLLWRIALLCIALSFPYSVVAKDRTQWADVSADRKAWFNSQQMNESARQRLGVPWKSCCDHGDIFRTRFRVIEDGSKYGAERYEYLKDGVWREIPPDIIKTEPSIEAEPILFINKNTGQELCFFISKDGGI